MYNTQHSLDILRTCRYLIVAAKSGDVNNEKRWVNCSNGSCTDGYLEVCSLLSDCRAKVDPLDMWKYTALHRAALAGRLSLVKLLVERGADVRLKNNNGQTASDVACSDGKKMWQSGWTR
jgi:ankyrin repeat protein